MGRLGGSVLVACSAAALVSGCDLILGVTDPPVPADGAVDAGRDGARSKDGASAGRDATVDGNGRPDAGLRQDGAQGHPDGAAGGDAPHHDATGDATPSVDATKDGTAPSDAARDGTSADAATDASDAGLPPACDAAADPFGSADAGPLVTFTPAGVGHIADIASADGTTFVWADDGTNTVNELQPGGGTLQLAAATGYAPGSVTVSTNGDVVWSRGEGAHLTFMQATLGLPLSGTSMTGPSVGAVVHGFVFDDAGARAYADLYAPDAGLSGLYCFPFAQTGVIPSCSHSGLYPTQNAGMASDGGSVSVALGPGAGEVFANASSGQLVEITPITALGPGFGQYSRALSTSGVAVGATFVAADGAHIYWASGATGQIHRTSLPLQPDAGSPTAVLTASAGPITGLASDGVSLFFTAGPTLFRVAGDGSQATAPRRLATVTCATLAHLKYVVAAKALIFDDGAKIHKLAP